MTCSLPGPVLPTGVYPETLRAKADYWDVWSAMFRDNFFKPQETGAGPPHGIHDTSESRGADARLNRGEDLIRNEGSSFRAMRYVGCRHRQSQ